MEEDKSNLKSVISNYPAQLKAELEFYNQLCLTRRPFDKIILCGMGGSALAGDFFSYFAAKRVSSLTPKIPIEIHRSYGLPASANSKSLIICVSYSGNTEETIAAFNAAKESDLEIAGLASGGQLAELFQANRIPWVKIPQGLQPRFSLGYQFKALIKIFMAYGILNSSAANETEQLVLSIKTGDLENEGKAIAQELKDKIPVIYASNENCFMARLWKIKFNENAKIPAFHNCFPELNHNEMVGWTRPLGNFSFLMLAEDDENPRVKQRMDLMAEIVKKAGLPVKMIAVKGESEMEKIFRTSILGDWISYYLAAEYGIDPAPVQMVEEFKKKLG